MNITPSTTTSQRRCLSSTTRLSSPTLLTTTTPQTTPNFSPLPTHFPPRTSSLHHSTTQISTPHPKTHRRHFSTQSDLPFTPNQMEKFQHLIDQQAEQDADDFFAPVENDEESDGPMTEPEDLASYTREFDPDNIKPELFDPNTQTTEYMVATIIQGEISKGVPMFPIYLRGPVFRKIITTLDRIQRAGALVDENVITKVLFDIFTNYAPDICRTHEHALNILFPLAPRLGDVVQLPNIIGQSIVSKREYIDNRDSFDDDTFENMKKDDDADIGRFMVITYECLHPTLRGKSFVSKHPFDLQVYTHAMRQDEKGLEQLMHERGMIDMYSGRIINPLDHAAKIPGLTGAGSKPLMVQQRATDENNSKYGIGSPALLLSGRPEPLKHRPEGLIAAPGQMLQLPGPGDLEGKTDNNNHNTRQIEGKIDHKNNLVTKLDHSLDSLSPDDARNELMKRQQYTVSAVDPTQHVPRDQKHYYQQMVLSGDKAAFMYRQLVQELTHGKSRFEKSGLETTQQSIAKQAKAGITIQDIKNHGAVNAKITSTGAIYGPDAFADFGNEIGNVGNNLGYPRGANIVSTATQPNVLMPLKKQHQLDREIEAALDEDIGTSSGSSKYFQQYKQMKIEQREEYKKRIQADPTQTFGEVYAAEEEQRNRIEILQDKFKALVQYHIDQGKTLEEAQVLADQQFDPETGEIIPDGAAAAATTTTTTTTTQEDAEGTEVDIDIVEDIAQQSYHNLPQRYKTKYKHILVKDGPGAGLPDPLAIDFGEDLFEIYPNANIALMDFLSDQWSLMVKEKQDQQSTQNAIQIQKEDEEHERLKRGEESKLNDDENAPKKIFTEDTNEHQENRMVIPKDIESTRYRLLAAVASAGQLAFTADYITDLFDRVTRLEQDTVAELADRYIPMKKIKIDKPNNVIDIENEPDFIYNFEQQRFKRQKKSQNEQNAKKIEEQENDPIDVEIVPEYQPPITDTAVSLTPEGYVKFGGKLLTQLEYAEQIFGKKPVPIEESNVVPGRMKQMINDHYRYRDDMNKKKQVNNVAESLKTGGGKKFSTLVQNNHLFTQDGPNSVLH
jgi:hypothetical protein